MPANCIRAQGAHSDKPSLLLQATWLLGLLRQDEAAAAAALRQVPESVVKDMASWLSFCIRMGRAGALCFLP